MKHLILIFTLTVCGIALMFMSKNQISLEGLPNRIKEQAFSILNHQSAKASDQESIQNTSTADDAVNSDLLTREDQAEPMSTDRSLQDPVDSAIEGIQEDPWESVSDNTAMQSENPMDILNSVTQLGYSPKKKEPRSIQRNEVKSVEVSKHTKEAISVYEDILKSTNE